VKRAAVHRTATPSSSRAAAGAVASSTAAVTRVWRARGVGLGVVLGLVAVATAAAEPVLHEYVDLGPGSGPIEPALTGPLGAPRGAPADAERAANGTDDDAAEGAASAGPAPTFSIDRDTARPDSVGYADPFTPTVVPFKRAVVYDGVDRRGDLLVRDDGLTEVPTVPMPRPNDESFHASFELDLVAGEPASIPSVAPGARLVLVSREPRVPLRIGFDSAENWFVTANTTRHVRLTLQIVADRRVFGSTYPDVAASALAPVLVPLPSEVKESALEVARALGISPSARPRDIVFGLVDHFRRFTASERRPTSQGLSLYRELALTARGICRHRAYAFMITALGLGVPTRMALNEAHAWVEVFDGEIWHRIDLGGAADRLESDDEGRPRHVEPHDPFAWPDRRESGLAMAERRAAPSASEPGAEAGPGQERVPGAEPSPPDPAEPGQRLAAPEAPLPSAPAAPPEPAPSEAPATPADVLLRTQAERAERGKSLFVSGLVQSGGRVCSGARVDISLVQPERADLPLGRLVTDPRGEFRGNLVIPWNAALGEHTVLATATGCAPRGRGVR